VYLLDSIAKTVGGVYIELFSSILYGLMTLAVKRTEDDAQTQKNIARMVNTWYGVFDDSLVSSIDAYIKSPRSSPTQAQFGYTGALPPPPQQSYQMGYQMMHQPPPPPQFMHNPYQQMVSTLIRD
jgi:hypothetical protein